MRQARFDWIGLNLLLLKLIFGHSHASDWEAPPDLCSTSKKPTIWAGSVPLLPTLPSQYSMKVEANILQTSSTTEVEEYYDSTNQRASVSVTRNGSTTVSIFNFKKNERYDIYSNGTCLVRTTDIDYFGFTRQSKENKPVMATVNEVFRFGSQFNLTFVGQESARGILVNHWTSCQNWDQLGATFQLDFFFSDPDYLTASARSEIPVRVVLNGVAHNIDMEDKQIQGIHSFQHSYEMTSFRAGPVLNEEVFHVPAGIVCDGGSDSRPFPQVPDQLEMTLEVLIPGSGRSPWLEHLRYDNHHKLAEIVTAPVTSAVTTEASISQGGHNGGNGATAVSRRVVRDYSAGIIYNVDESCTVFKMPTVKMWMSMSHGQSLLAATIGSKQPVYQGQKTFRQMLVEAWALEQDEITTEFYFWPNSGHQQFQTMLGMFIKNKTSNVSAIALPELIRDVLQNGPKYESKPEVKEVSEDVGNQLFWGKDLQQFLDRHASQKLVNVFKYGYSLMKNDFFDISECFSAQEISKIIIFVIADFVKDVLDSSRFYISLRDALSQSVGVSVLHIHRLSFEPFKHENLSMEVTKSTFTILGSVDKHGIAQKPLTEAKRDFVTAITNGISFRVQYDTFYKDFSVHKTMYTLDYDKDVNSDRTGTAFSPGPQISDEKRQKQTLCGDSSEKTLDVKNSYVSEQTYSRGTVVGVAIGTFALGVIISLGIMFLVQRRRDREEPLLSDTPSNL